MAPQATHQGRAEERGPRPVELKAGQLADRDHDVGRNKDDDGGNCAARHPSWRCEQTAAPGQPDADCGGQRQDGPN